MQKEKGTADGQEKVLTKYDRKMEARRKAEEKERRIQYILKWTGILLCAAVVVAFIGGIGSSIYKKHAALNNTFIRIGSHEVTKLEYDYYYYSGIQDYKTMYSSVMGIMGIDFSKDLSKQPYTDVMSWKDFFDKLAVGQITQIKLLGDEAAEQGFTADTSENYSRFQQNLSTGAEAAGITLEQHCKNIYGPYATPENIVPIIKESLLASAYYEELVKQNAPAQSEVSAYYEEHKNEYDTVDYRILPFKADLPEEASEDEVADALAILSRTAEEMKEAVEAGGDFKELCKEYAPEDIRADYEEEEKDASLKEDAAYAQTNKVYGEWLFEDGRTEGELTVVSDVTNRESYVVQFLARNKDEAADENIGSTLSTQAVEEYLKGKKEQYTLENTAGKLEYIDKEDAQYEAERKQAENAASNETESVPETEETTGAPQE